ncbi:Protein of unknown function [Spirosomataceae bacterium TFI 002]|nr:Protein of unknown function [Spirosomataceae bacterium TFI 002]
MKIFPFLILFALHAFAEKPSQKDLEQVPPNVIRTCCAFGHDLSIARIPFLKRNDLIDYNNIGQHQYLGGPKEQNGIVYTSRGGFIDLGHLRDYADWTVYLYNLLESKQANEVFKMTLGNEGGTKSLEITIPSQKIDLYELAGSIAYDLSLWHEIATWYGSSYIPLIPEAYSSFSPEDLYSNLLGVRLGIEAAKSHLPYEEAMDQLLAEKLLSLGVVDLDKTYDAMNEVEGYWWSSTKALPSSNVLLKRYFDEAHFLSPWLVNNYIEPVIIYKPDQSLHQYYDFKIENSHKIKSESLSLSKTNNVITQRDFPGIIELIKAENLLMEMKIIQKQEKVDIRKLKKEVRKIAEK